MLLRVSEMPVVLAGEGKNYVLLQRKWRIKKQFVLLLNHKSLNRVAEHRKTLQSDTNFSCSSMNVEAKSSINYPCIYMISQEN